ncbi:uncharacterized protein [Pagrus major]|uniref:uncharacterized protein n=1 Tax=Pagrus major TaxID=143350 RepID=UPI003CC84BDF
MAQLQTRYINVTEKRDQLQTRYNNLTEERDQLQTSNNNLKKERDQLQTRYNNLTQERDQLQTRYNNLTQERDQLQTRYNNLTQERDQLQTIYNQISNRDELQASYNNLTEERDQLQTSYNNLTEERDQLQTSFNNLTEERDQLQTSFNNLTEERDQLQTGYNNLTEERDQLQTSFNNLTEERDQLQTSFNNLTEERDQLQTSYNQLDRKSLDIEARFKALTEERDELKTKLVDIANSQQGWIYFSGSFYYISSTTKTWQESRDDCLQRGADLMIINSKEEQSFTRQLKDDLWIGLTDTETEGTWKWVDGTPLNTSYWLDGEPNNAGQAEDCGEDFSLFLSSIKANYSQQGWIYFSGSFYYISSTTKTWQESRDDCLQRGADLMIINSKEEQSFTRQLKDDLWIGLTDTETEGTWKWVDGTPLNTSYWLDGEPNNAGQAEDCGEDFITQHQKIMWIGLTDRGMEGVWKWVDGTRLTTSFWGSGEPNSYRSRNEDCVIINFFDNVNNWNDETCEYENFWMCEKKMTL